MIKVFIQLVVLFLTALLSFGLSVASMVWGWGVQPKSWLIIIITHILIYAVIGLSTVITSLLNVLFKKREEE
jgi:ABC-type multidrug transport system permease subunit